MKIKNILRNLLIVIICFGLFWIQGTIVYADFYMGPPSSAMFMSLGMITDIITILLLMISIIGLAIGKCLGFETYANRMKKVMKVLIYILIYSIFLSISLGMIGYIDGVKADIFNIFCMIILLIGFIVYLWYRLRRNRELSNIIIKILVVMFISIILLAWSFNSIVRAKGDCNLFDFWYGLILFSGVILSIYFRVMGMKKISKIILIITFGGFVFFVLWNNIAFHITDTNPKNNPLWKLTSDFFLDFLGFLCF